MQKTKILISLYGDSLKQDAMETDNFIRRLNDCYLDRGHYFTPILDDAISNDSTGETGIADCALAFFLTEPGPELPETYKTALNSYNKTGKPRIFVYTKSDLSAASGQLSGDGSSTAASTRSSVPNSKLQTPNSTLFPTRPCSHIDTLKLEILMQIKQLNLDGVDIHLEDGKAWQGNTVLLSLENVEAVSGYENLQNLKKKRAELESRYYASKTRHAENPDDADAYEAFFEASKQRSEALQEIRDVEAQLYHMMEGMYEQTANGKLTTRQAEGYRLIERGLLNEARTVLDFDAIISESRHHEELAEQAAKRAQDSVNELMQLKDVNATLLDWDAVDACYKEAVRLEEKYDLPLKAAINLDPAETDYLSFLIYQYRHSEAMEIGERLIKHFEMPGSGVADEYRSLLCNYLGIVYYETHRIPESENMLRRALSIRKARTDGDPDAIAKDIAIVYNNLGNMYNTAQRYEEAIQAHEAALEIRKRLVESNPDAFTEYLAYTYTNLGDVYNETKRYDEAVGLMLLAKDIFKELAVIKPVPHLEFLADCYCNLGISYTRSCRFAEAEKQLGLALEIQKEQAENDPGIYEPRVAKTYSDFGRLYISAKRYADAEESYNIALKMLKRLAERTPDAFETELARYFMDLSELYSEVERFPEAENALSNAITLYSKYAQENPSCAEKAADATKALDSMKEAQRLSRGASDMLTQEEKEVALLLTEGMTRRDIARKLHIDVSDVAEHEKSVKKKLNLMGTPDPVIAAIVTEYKLTKRETEVLYCFRRITGIDEIAAELFLSEETVRGHVRNLLYKLPVTRREKIPEWLATYQSGH